MKKYLVFCLIVVLCLTGLFGSCKKQVSEEYSVFDLERNPVMCKIVSTQSEFALQEDVVITIAYGWMGYPSWGGVEDNTLVVKERKKMDLLAYNTYNNATQNDWENEVFIKTIEDFFSLEYKITPTIELIYNKKKEIIGDKWTRFEFSYSEEITIPNSLLEDDVGYVLLYLVGTNYAAIDVFKYKKNDNIITITETTYNSKEYEGVEFIVKNNK